MAKLKVDDWFNRIDAAKKIYQPHHKEYKNWVNFFRGNQWTAEEAASTINPLVINYVFNTIKTMVPTLYFKNPKIYVHATRPEFAKNAANVQEVVNYDWRILGVKREIKRTVLRSLIGGISWIETGYVFEVEPENDSFPTFDENAIDQSINGATEEEETTKQEFTEFRIKKDSPFAISRSQLEVITDPFCNVLEESAWSATCELKPIEMVKRDPRFEGTKNLEPSATFDDEIMLNNFRAEYRKNADLKFIELWHVTDRWEGKTFTIARAHKRKLRNFDTPQGYSLIPLYFNEDPESTKHISVVDQMSDQQQEKNKLRAYMLEHVKRSLPRMGYDKTMMTNEADVNRLVNSDMDELIPLPGRPVDVLMPINFPSLPADMFNVDSRLNEDMQIASGLTDFQRGQAIKVPSASEAQFIEQNSRLRVDEGLDVVSDFAAQIAENLIKLRQKFTTGENVVPIIGDNRAVEWKTYTDKDIEGEFEFIPEYGSTQKRDQDFMKAQLTQVLPIVQNLVVSNNPQLYELGRRALKVFEWPEPEIEKIFPTQSAQPLQGSQAQPGGSPQGPAGGIDIQSLLTGLGRA